MAVNYENVKDILTSKPKFIVKWGMTILFAVTIGCMISLLFIKYPETNVLYGKLYLLNYSNNDKNTFLIQLSDLSNNQYVLAAGKKLQIVSERSGKEINLDGIIEKYYSNKSSIFLSVKLSDNINPKVFSDINVNELDVKVELTDNKTLFHLLLVNLKILNENEHHGD